MWTRSTESKVGAGPWTRPSEPRPGDEAFQTPEPSSTRTSHLFQPLDALGDRRVRGEDLLHRAELLALDARGLREPEVGGGVVRRVHRRGRRGDLAQRRGEPRRVPGEHHALRVGEELAVARDGSLDDLPGDRSDHHEGETDAEQDQRGGTAVAVIPAPAPEPAP